jgi:hypothetical protein
LVSAPTGQISMTFPLNFESKSVSWKVEGCMWLPRKRKALPFELGSDLDLQLPLDPIIRGDLFARVHADEVRSTLTADSTITFIGPTTWVGRSVAACYVSTVGAYIGGTKFQGRGELFYSIADGSLVHASLVLDFGGISKGSVWVVVELQSNRIDRSVIRVPKLSGTNSKSVP